MWRVGRGWQEREGDWICREVLKESRCPERRWRWAWGVAATRDSGLGLMRVASTRSRLPWVGVPPTGRTAQPQGPGIWISTAKNGLPLPPLFSWPSSFPPLSCSSCRRVSGRPEKRKHTGNTPVCNRKPSRPASSPLWPPAGAVGPAPTHALHLLTGTDAPPGPPSSLPRNTSLRPRGEKPKN